MSSHTHSYSIPRQSRQWRTAIATITEGIRHEFSHLIQSLAGSREPHVWQRQDASGQLWWHGYDPVSDHHICCTSEEELRIWLESRYYFQ